MIIIMIKNHDLDQTRARKDSTWPGFPGSNTGLENFRAFLKYFWLVGPNCLKIKDNFEKVVKDFIEKTFFVIFGVNQFFELFYLAWKNPSQSNYFFLLIG